MGQLIYHPGAMAEVREAAAFYEAARSGLGERFLEAVDKAAERLGRQPLIWRTIEGPWRRMIIHDFPYAFIYRVDGDVVFIAAVMHMSRKPGYWKSRRGP